jgi:hypothetical protein
LFISSRHLNKKRMPLVGQGAVVGQTGKTGRSNVGQPMRVHGRARRYPAAGRSRDEWFGMQLTVSSFDFCLPAVARCRLEGEPRTEPEGLSAAATGEAVGPMQKRNVH